MRNRIFFSRLVFCTSYKANIDFTRRRHRSILNVLSFNVTKLIILSFLILLPWRPCPAQTIKLPSHPNHYIILIDASGSTIETAEKQNKFRYLLTDFFPRFLFRNGFGASIPPIVPDEDVMSLLHFGIVNEYNDAAFKSLKKYSFFADYIHPKLINQKGVDEKRFKNMVWPDVFYRITVLAWSRPLALDFLLKRNYAGESHRVFLITVHDGLFNAGTIQEEVNLAENWGNRQQLPGVKEAIRRINESYLLTDGKRAEGRAWSQDIAVGDEHFFLEAYELLSKARSHSESRLAGMKAISKSSFSWEKQKGANPKGNLVVRLNDGFLDFLKRESVSISLSFLVENNQQDKNLDLGSKLSMPVILPHSLSCERLNSAVILNVKIPFQDALLGRRIIQYQDEGDIKTPVPTKCTIAYIAKRIVLILALLFLTGLIIWFYYFSHFSTHIKIKLPSLHTPIRVLRRRDRNGRTPLHPTLSEGAFYIWLPARWKQRLFYSGASIGVNSKEDCLFHFVINNMRFDQIGLPIKARRIGVWWEKLPAEPVTTTMTFSHKRQSSQTILCFPAGIREGGTSSMNQSPLNYISLDMGSESIAAFCRPIGETEGFSIDLQKYAEILLGCDAQKIQYYQQKEGVRSSRLRNLISIHDNRQKAVLPWEHAKLEFIDRSGNLATDRTGQKNYSQSIFEYFHKKDQFLGKKILPNPKLAFQSGAKSIIPEIESSDKIKVIYEPELLVHHMISQIVNNFILRSPELIRRNICPENSCLILTIPNVYSLNHAQSIRHYLQNVTRFKEIELLYESDAIAYYAHDRRLPNEKLKEYFENITNLIREKKVDGFHIFTIDVGHGTTDLSLIEIMPLGGEKGGNSDQLSRISKDRFYVRGRTGKSDGGSRLNYVFAQHYNDCLREILGRSDFRIFELGFDFLTGASTFEQEILTNKLESLIVGVKKSINKRFEITLDAAMQEKSIGEIAESWIKTTKREKPQEIVFIEEKQEAFSLAIKQAFHLRKFPGPLRSFYVEFICGKLKLGSAQSRDLWRLAKLRRKIEDYVKDNVDHLIRNLIDMSATRENIEQGQKYQDRQIIDVRTTLAVVAGQGAQFVPIKEAIHRQLDNLGINPKYRIYLEGDEAKEACCKGAITYKMADDYWANQREIHGTYGFINEAGLMEWAVCNTKELNEGNDVIVEFMSPSTFWFFYSPRPFVSFGKDNGPQFFDGTTALIRNFSPTNRFSVKYDPNNLSFIVNGQADIGIATYGMVPVLLFPRIWPTVLLPQYDKIWP